MIVFVAVIDQGGFAPAARALGMSASAVSRHIQELEQALGAQLLRRTTRRLSLTEAGERYLPSAREILANIRDLHDEIASLHETPRGRLRITASHGFGDYTLSPITARFAAKYPELSLEIDHTNRVVDLVAEGYDAGVRSGHLRDSSLLSRRIAELDFVCCASPKYLAERGAPERPEDLARHDCVHWRWRDGTMTWRFYERGAANPPPVEVLVRGRFLVSGVLAEREGARAGLGVALLPPAQIAEDFAEGRLVPLLENFEPEKEPISIVWPGGGQTPRKLRVFIDFVVAEIGACPNW